MDTSRILNFLSQLAINNNREWFNEHKSEYLYCKAEIESFTQQWLDAMKEIDPATSELQVKDCIYRIYRDTRFSADKTPYKKWFGIIIAPHGGRKSVHGCYYLHLQPNECLFAGGIWCPDSDLIRQLRQDIYDNYEELESIFGKPDVYKFFPSFDSHDMLKKVPAPFPKEFAHPDWISRKSFTFEYRLSNEEIQSPSLLSHILDACRAAKPINEFLNYTVDNM